MRRAVGPRALEAELVAAVGQLARQGMSVGATFNFAFAPDGAGNIKVWEPTDSSLNAYTLLGTATGDGAGTFVYEFTENMGNDVIDLGDTIKTYTFTVTAP